MADTLFIIKKIVFFNKFLVSFSAHTLNRLPAHFYNLLDRVFIFISIKILIKTAKIMEIAKCIE